MRLNDVHNSADFRELARRSLPATIFSYIDAAADDQTAYRITRPRQIYQGQTVVDYVPIEKRS